MQIQRDILALVEAAGIGADVNGRPLFRSTARTTGQLTGNALTSRGISEMVKRAAGSRARAGAAVAALVSLDIPAVMLEHSVFAGTSVTSPATARPLAPEFCERRQESSWQAFDPRPRWSRTSDLIA
jgi:hypothetical protein